MRLVVLAALAAGVWAPSALAQPLGVPERPTVDVYIRSQAGLPASSAKGEIEVVELGSHPTDATRSIVGRRNAGGWRVSYVCAQSPTCDPRRFLFAKEFDLSPDAAKRLEALLDRLKAEPDAGAQASGAGQACGRLAVAIDDRGFKRDYRRACSWGGDLGELETLLKAGLP
jgi:hypothetical protein